MAAKRRKTSDAVVAPEPKRRVTRSWTKSQPSTEKRTHVASPEKSTTTKNAPKPQKKSKINREALNTDVTAKSNEASPSANNKFSTTPTTNAQQQQQQPYTTLTIPSSLIQTPIQCHHYTPRTPTTQTLLFTHGAGGTLSAPAILNFCTGFASSTPILAFQGSMNLGSRVKGFHACISHLSSLPADHKNGSGKSKKEAGEETLLLGGRSMGSRAAVICASEHLSSHPQTAIKLILVSYPLVGPKDTRDQILFDLSVEVEVLFLVGDRDTMCPIDKLNETRGKMEARSQLVVVRGADHGMHVKPARREREVGEETGRVAARWRGMSFSLGEKRKRQINALWIENRVKSCVCVCVC